MQDKGEFKVIIITWLVMGFMWASFESYSLFNYRKDAANIEAQVENILELPNIRPEDNAFFTAAAFIIPEGMDSEQFGLDLFYAFDKQATGPDDNQWLNKEIPTLANEINEFLVFEAPGHLNYYCPLFQKHIYKHRENCAIDADMVQISQNNQAVLTRYKKRLQKPHYYEHPRFRQVFETGPSTERTTFFYNWLMIDLAKNGRYEDAIEGWIEHREYLSRALSGHSRRRLKNNLSNYVRRTDESLPMILKHIPADVIARYKPALFETLNRESFGENGLNLEAMFIADYYYTTNSYASSDTIPQLSNWFSYKEKERKKSWLEFRSQILELAAQDSARAFHPMRQKIWDEWSTDLQNEFLIPMILFNYGRYYIDDYYVDLKFWEMLRNRMVHKSYMGMLKLYIHARSENISAEDMETFVNNHAGKYHDNFGEQTYKWFAKTSSIYYMLDASTGHSKLISYP